MKKIESNTDFWCNNFVLDWRENFAQRFLDEFPDAEVELVDVCYYEDCAGNDFHEYKMCVSKKNATPEMLEWAKNRDFLGNDGQGLGEDADDNAVAIEFILTAVGDGDLWIENAKQKENQHV